MGVYERQAGVRERLDMIPAPRTRCGSESAALAALPCTPAQTEPQLQLISKKLISSQLISKEREVGPFCDSRGS